MKKLLAIVATAFCSQFVAAQVYFTKTGLISFYSHTAVEDIKAENFETVSFLDAAKGELRFQVLIKGFKFPKAAMQEHFNTPAYMDSDKFPKSEFKGNILNLSTIDFNKDGNYKVEVDGELTMHGVSKKIKQSGTLSIKNGKPALQATFKINRTDYGVKVPSFTAAKIAEELEITVKCDYEPYKS